MPKHLISITEVAEQDLAEIVGYIASDNPEAALKLVEDIEQSILMLEDFPLTGTTPKNRRLARQGYRILIVHNYLVFYVLLNNEMVEIRRIICLIMADSTLIKMPMPGFNLIKNIVTTLRTTETVWPSHFKKMCPAIFFSLEHFLKLKKCNFFLFSHTITLRT